MPDSIQPNSSSQNQASKSIPTQKSGAPVIDLRVLDQQASSNIKTTTTTSPVRSQTSNTAAPAGNVTGGDDDQYVILGTQKYAIPSLVREKFPDLIQLIKETESMNDEERAYWFQILPIMTEEQITKFRVILVNEKEQLARLDKEYQEELDKLNEKHVVEWKAFEAREKKKALTAAEQQANSQEQAEEEDLLKRLSQV